MSRVSGCLWLGVALVLALIAGGAAFIVLQKATASQAAGASPVATTQVLVAVHPVALGALLSEADLAVQTVPQNTLPTGALAAPKDAAGQVTTVPLSSGEMVLAHHLVMPDVKSGHYAFTLPNGKVAVTLAASDLLSTAGLLNPNDHVDLLYSLKVKRTGAMAQGQASSEEQMWSFGTLLNVTVVSVIPTGAGPAATDQGKEGKDALPAPAGPARAYVLALDPQDALTLKYLKDANAILDLALRNSTDESDHTAKPVDMNYLIDRYQLPVCQGGTCQMPVR